MTHNYISIITASWTAILEAFKYQSSFFTGLKVVSGDYYFTIIGDNIWSIATKDSNNESDCGKFSGTKVIKLLSKTQLKV